MRISELSEATGVPVPTLKYYLREGLLMSGVASARTRADYGDEHVSRVRLVRALIEQGGVGIAGVHAILTALDDPPTTRHGFLGAAHQVVPLPGADSPVSDEVRALLDRLGWQVEDDAPAARSLSASLVALRRAGIPTNDALEDAYAHAMEAVARLDLQMVDAAGGPAEALGVVVIANVLTDPILVALRRLAQEALSAARELS